MHRRLLLILLLCGALAGCASGSASDDAAAHDGDHDDCRAAAERAAHVPQRLVSLRRGQGDAALRDRAPARLRVRRQALPGRLLPARAAGRRPGLQPHRRLRPQPRGDQAPGDPRRRPGRPTGRHRPRVARLGPGPQLGDRDRVRARLVDRPPLPHDPEALGAGDRRRVGGRLWRHADRDPPSRDLPGDRVVERLLHPHDAGGRAGEARVKGGGGLRGRAHARAASEAGLHAVRQDVLRLLHRDEGSLPGLRRGQQAVRAGADGRRHPARLQALRGRARPGLLERAPGRLARRRGRPPRQAPAQ